MFSKLFGRKKDSNQNAQYSSLPHVSDYSFLTTDMHSHLIPGIDDGAQTIEDSLTLIRQLQSLGYKSLVTTPHIKSDHFPNNSANILNGLELLQNTLHDEGIHMPLKAAAEYYIDDHFMQLLDTEPLLTVTGNHVLVELSFMFEPARFYDILFRIQTKGYKPILAHPERYAYYHDKKGMYSELKARGCLLQLNLIALVGYYGKPVKNIAEELLKEGLYDYCGTDMHHMKHAEALSKLLQSDVIHLLSQQRFLNNSILL